MQNNATKPIWEDDEALFLVKGLLMRFDPNSEREGLQETPKRYLKFLHEFTNPPKFIFTTFQKEKYDQMIVVAHIPFFSLCEHHLAPFFGVGHIGYVPNDKGKICGISKLPRTLDMFSRRFQNQERITDQVADFLMENLDPKGVAVELSAQHLCMAMRGVQKHDTWTITTALRGCFKDEDGTRAEFFNKIQNAR